MKTIVVPTDFSDISTNAANYATDMALMMRAKLHLIHVYSVSVQGGEAAIAYISASEMEANAWEQINRLKEKLLARTNGNVIIHGEVREGDVANEIEDYCTKVNPYAIVIGAESASALERFFAMGETLRMLQHLHWPLIVVPPSANFRGIRKIGFACDFRRVLESVSVQELRTLVETFDAELHVLHVSEEDSTGYSADTIMESGWLQEMLGALRPKYHFIRDADIEKGINDFAEQNKLDLLIIIPKKHNLISRIFRHSHSKRTVLHAHVPVMAIHE